MPDPSIEPMLQVRANAVVAGAVVRVLMARRGAPAAGHVRRTVTACIQ